MINLLKMSTEKQNIAFPYYGGKQKHVKDIVPMLPRTTSYCEPFCGSAAILLNRDPVEIETISDLNDDIANFFQVLRDRPDDLIRLLELTPFSRKELQDAWYYHPDPVERARRLFVRTTIDTAKAGRKQDTGFSCSVVYYKGKHSYPPKNFAKKVYNLDKIAMRLRMVQIENRPALFVIDRFDSYDTLFYCDPPYLHDSRTSGNDYKYEMSVQDHEDLATKLNTCKGLVCVSGYDHPMMDELYSAKNGWYKFGFKARRVPMSKKRLTRQEIIWTNYDPLTLCGQTKLNLD